MSGHSKFVNDLEARKLVEARWPKAKIDICNSFKHGEYNPLRCCREKGHAGEHNYVVVRNDRDMLK